MYDDILFPTDGSDATSAVLPYAADLASTYGATLHLLYVADTTTPSTTRIQGSIIDALVETGDRIIEEAEDAISTRDQPVVTEVVQGVPHEAILGYADRSNIDLVLVPTHGRTGFERFVLGSVAERIVRLSTVPVLTVRPDDDLSGTYPYRRVLVPTDGSTCANAALDAGIDVAKTHDAALDVLSVVDVASLGFDVHSELETDTLTENADETVAEATERAEVAGVDAVTGAVRRGSSVFKEIRSYVEEEAVDLVVVGTHGRTGLDRVLLGSVAEKLVRRCPVPVMTVREGDSDT